MEFHLLDRDDRREGGEEWIQNYSEIPANPGISLIFESTTKAGQGPRLHLHPYPETFVIRRGGATFTVGRDDIDAHAGQILVVPAATPHKFVTHEGGYEAVHIHSSPRFETTWLD
ncbi:cupin domain-containing protein [Brevibacterium oceani]|uniref:cupin domain-containing protein n=1 Tax=Brevibacterium oceani TaxID=358099 RepID=UPI001B342C47|nr:cupin domain-containing protein [Brevibacterium oceani]